MTRDTARFLALLFTLALFIGTLMPGSWVDAATRPFGLSARLPALAHVLLFAGISFTVPPAQLWKVRSWHVFALGLALALLTEGLQHFAIDRHPNLAGVVQDMIGTTMGWALGRMRRQGRAL